MEDIKVIEFLTQDIQEFKRDVFPMLFLDEIKTNMQISIINNVIKQNDYYGSGIFIFVAKGIDHEQKEIVLATVIKTPPHNLILYISDPEKKEIVIPKLIDYIYHHYSHTFINGILGDHQYVPAFTDYWSQYLSLQSIPFKQEVQFNIRFLALFPENFIMSYITGRSEITRLALMDDLDLIKKWVFEFYVDINESKSQEECDPIATGLVSSQNFYILEDNHQTVSIAALVGSTGNGGRIAYVYTPPELRGKGYCTVNMTHVCHLLFQEKGMKYLCLSADKSNPISNKVYEKIGFRFHYNLDVLNFFYS